MNKEKIIRTKWIYILTVSFILCAYVLMPVYADIDIREPYDNIPVCENLKAELLQAEEVLKEVSAGKQIADKNAADIENTKKEVSKTEETLVKTGEEKEAAENQLVAAGQNYDHAVISVFNAQEELTEAREIQKSQHADAPEYQDVLFAEQGLEEAAANKASAEELLGKAMADLEEIRKEANIRIAEEETAIVEAEKKKRLQEEAIIAYEADHPRDAFTEEYEKTNAELMVLEEQISDLDAAIQTTITEIGVEKERKAGYQKKAEELKKLLSEVQTELDAASKAAEAAKENLLFATAETAVIYFSNYDKDGNPEAEIPADLPKEYAIHVEGVDDNNLTILPVPGMVSGTEISYKTGSKNTLAIVYSCFVGYGCWHYEREYEAAAEWFENLKKTNETYANYTMTLESKEVTVYYQAIWKDRSGKENKKYFRIISRNYGKYAKDMSREDKYNQILADIISDGMSDYEKFEAIVQYTASDFDYNARYSSAASMLEHGAGDCWASSDMIKQLGTRAGLDVRIRNGNIDGGAGSGHANAIVAIDGRYYIGEAGYYGTKPRHYSVTEEAYGCTIKGADLVQYDGFDKDVYLPDTITTIGGGESGMRNAFYSRFSTSEAENVYIPASVTDISGWAFTEAETIKNIYISTDNPNYCSIDGCVYSSDRSKLVAVPYGKAYVEIPETVETILGGSIYYINTSHKDRSGAYDMSSKTIHEGTYIICGKAGTAAEAYATENRNLFLDMDDPEYQSKLETALSEMNPYLESDAIEAKRDAYGKMDAETLSFETEEIYTVYEEADTALRDIMTRYTENKNQYQETMAELLKSDGRISQLASNQARDESKKLSVSAKHETVSEKKKSLEIIKAEFDRLDAGLSEIEAGIRNSTVIIETEQKDVENAESEVESKRTLLTEKTDTYNTAQATLNSAYDRLDAMLEEQLTPQKTAYADAVQELQNAETSLEEARKRQAAAATAYNVAENEYNVALGKYLDLVSAHSDYQEEQIKRNAAYNDAVKAYEDALAGYQAVHTLTTVDETDPTCTEAGNTEYWTCENCGKIYADAEGRIEISLEDVILPATGHIWNEVYTTDREASCREEGIASIHCGICGEILEGSEITVDKTTHTYSDWVTVKAPSAEEEGMKERTCFTCGHKEQLTLDKLPTIWENPETNQWKDESDIADMNSAVDQNAPFAPDGNGENRIRDVQVKVNLNNDSQDPAKKKAQPMKVTAKRPSVKAEKLEKKKQTIKKGKAFKIKNAQGTVTFKKKGGSKKLTISKKGKITVKKGTKKGTYRIKVKVTASGNEDYKKGSKTVTVRVKVE